MFRVIRWFGAYGDTYLARVCGLCVTDSDEDLGETVVRGCERCGGH